LPTLSAIIITKNEALNIADCLDSVAFCDEIVVIDSGSEDDTVKLAQARGARVLYRPFEGFGKQFNNALAEATGDWVLSVDADERVTAALAAEIRSAIAAPKAEGYKMPRSSSFCGRTMRHSGWYPDYVLRVWRRGRARWTDDLVHPSPVCQGPVARLREPLIHHPMRHIEDALRRLDSYSSLSAQMIVASGRRVSFATGILHGLWAFFRAYVLRLGFLDGREGFLLAVLIAEGSYYRYMKAWLLGRRRA
jgi:glycosyltransferase involved in cell wall biosynthesis